MKNTEPQAEIFECTHEEYRKFMENEVRLEFGMTVDEFTAKFYDGTLDIYDPGVANTASMLSLKLNKRKTN